MFWLGTAAVTAGVILHLPIFIMSAPMHYRMVGMPMGNGMLVGMALIVLGIIAAGLALVRPAVAEAQDSLPALLDLPAQEPRLTRVHWMPMATITIALVIDVMEPASRGFVVLGNGGHGEHGAAFPLGKGRSEPTVDHNFTGTRGDRCGGRIECSVAARALHLVSVVESKSEINRMDRAGSGRLAGGGGVDHRA